MAPIDEVVQALDALLDPAAFDDYGPNGLQVPGRPEVRRLVTGGTAQRALIERAVELDADLVLVHYGLFWKFVPAGLTRVLAERVRPLFKHDVAPAAYHLPLDAHPEVGNNALLAEHLDYARPRGVRRDRSGRQLRRRCRRARGGIHFIAAGHYAMETFGVRRLGDWLADAFGLEHHWIDILNPV